jgi:hypothetical protein
MKSKNPKLGDVIEFQVGDGVAYAMYTHEHPEYGSLLRVWNRVHEVGCTDLQTLVQAMPSFTCFFSLRAALSRGIVKIAGHIAIPQNLLSFPIFRTGMVGPDGSVNSWWLWDGNSSLKVGDLTVEQSRLPVRGIWNDTIIVSRVEQGWTDASGGYGPERTQESSNGP